MVNVTQPDQVAKSLQTARDMSYKVALDPGHILLQLRDKKSLRKLCKTLDAVFL
jgi:hypothetical protein